MTPSPTWLSGRCLVKVFHLARVCGGEARVVGGAVRGLYLGSTPAHHAQLPLSDTPISDPDIDVAISVPIIEFAEAARTAGLAVYETGLRHGTVTVCEADSKIEVTQLRTDHDGDGRHARIEPTKSWQADAERRDFTMNALYMDETGNLYDPVGGLADVKDGRLRFIGEARKRLAEDYLRLLRALRFRAQYPNLWMADSDREALEAALAGLASLSAERIAAELSKLCDGAGVEAMIAEMRTLSVDKALFGTGFVLAEKQMAKIRTLWPFLNFTERLALLLGRGQRTKAVKRLKLSRRDIKQAKRLEEIWPEDRLSLLGADAWQRAVYILSPDAVFAYAEAVLAGLVKPDEARLRHIASFQLPRCPVKGGDIKAAFGLSGSEIGAKLAELEAMWVASDFKMTGKELLAAGGDE